MKELKVKPSFSFSQYHINLLTSWAALALGLIAVFYLTPYMITSFGNYKYGIWLLINSIVGYVNLAEAGVNISTGRFVNIHIGKNELKKASQVLSTSLMFFLILPFIVLPTIAFVSSIFIDDLLADMSIIDDAFLAIIITSATLFVNIIAANIRVPLNVNQRFDIISFIEIVNTITRTGLIIYFLSFENTRALTYISLATLLAALVTVGLSIFCVIRYGKKIPLRIKNIDLTIFRKIIGFGGWVLLGNFGVMSINYSDNIVISSFLGASEIVYFSIGFMLSKYMVSILSKISQIKIPIITQLIGSNDIPKLKDEFIEMLTMVGIFALPVVVVFCVQAEPFINLWMGAEYTSSALIGITLVIPAIFSFAVQGIGATLWAKGIVKTLGLVKVSIALLNVLLSIAFIHLIENQLYGIALGTAITSLIETLIIIPILARKEISITYRSIIRIHIIFAVFTYLLYLLINYAYPFVSDSWVMLIINSFIILLVGLMCAKIFFRLFNSFLILNFRTSDKL